MDRFSFIFTIFFMLLGPIKLIPIFGGLTRDKDSRFKRDVAIRGVLIAFVLCAFVALAGGGLLAKYEISLAALRIAGGLVLLIAALQAIFQKDKATSPDPGTPTALQMAASPLAIPGIVPPAGIAAILIAMTMAPQYPGMTQAVAICLAIVMALNFLVMFFIDEVMKITGLSVILTVLGTVLIFVQLGLAVDTMLNGFKDLVLVQVK